MDIGMGILLLGSAVIFPFVWIISFASKKLGLNIGINGPAKMLSGGIGGGEEVKKFDKPPVSNPQQPAPASANSKPGDSFNSGSIPYMGGVENGNSLAGIQDMTSGMGGVGPAMGGSAPAMGGGMGVVATVGVANFVGIGSQNGNVKNTFKAIKQQIGNIRQTASALNNIKLKAPKGLAQNALNNINNTTRRVGTMNQGAPLTYNAINRGRVNMRQLGNSSNNIVGNVKRISATRNHIHTSHLKMRPISRVQSLNVQNFYAKKGLAKKLSRISNGLPANEVPRIGTENQQVGVIGQKQETVNSQVGMGGLQQGNLQFNVNDINTLKNSNYKVVNQQVVAPTVNNSYDMELRNKFDSDPKNQGLNEIQKTKVYNVSRYIEQRSAGVSAEKYFSDKKRNERIMDGVRFAVKVYPGATEQDLLKISQNAIERNKFRDEGRKMIAAQQANAGNNYSNDERKNKFDEALKGTEAANIRMEDWVNKNFSDQINNISDERKKEIRKQAEEYELKSRTTSLEEKEAMHAKETGEVDEFDSSDYYGDVSEDQRREMIIQQKMEELTNEEVEGNRQAVIEAIKDQFIENPDDFRSVLGDEFVNKYKTALNGSEEEFKKRYAEELAKIDVKEQMEYLKKNPDKKKMNYYEVYKARKQEEFNNDIIQAAGALYSQGSEMSQYQQSLSANMPAPSGASGIYINRYAREQGTNSDNV